MTMSAVAGGGAKAVRWAPWQTMGIVAAVAILGGLLLPQLLPGEMAIDKSHHKAEAKADSNAPYEATALADMPHDGLVTKQVPYIGDVTLPDGGSAIAPDETKRAQLVTAMLIAPPQPTPPPDAGALAALAPSALRVDVENGTGVPGMAKRVAALLRSEGFKIAQVGNAASGNVATTEVHEHSRVANAGLKVRNGLGSRASRVPVISEAVSSQTPSPSDVTVIIGDDLVTAMSSPPASQ